MPVLERRDEVFVLDLGGDGNYFTPAYVAQLVGLLDEVAVAPPPRALVTAATGKAWALGLDLAWIGANPDGVDELVQAMHRLDARMLELPVPTVAAIQGHAFAGGAMFALAHDFRVMRADRGFFCLPEIDGHLPFTPGLTELVRSRLAPQVAHAALTSGRRYGGGEALAAGIVDELADVDGVLDCALAVAIALAGKDPATLGAIKAQLYGDVLAALRDAEANRAAPERFAAALALLGADAGRAAQGQG
jgi:enoyl-CoA hydratase/carnithine racemase